MYDGASPSTPIPHTPKPANVRAITQADEQAVLAMLREGHDENGTFAFSDTKVLAMIQKSVNRQGAMIGVIDGADGLAASVGLLLESYWYTDEWNLSELWAFVRKPYRNSSYASDLIEFGKWAADSMGLSLNMGIMSTVRTEAKVRLYRRKLTQIGAFFMWGLERTKGPLGREVFEKVKS